MASFSSEKKKKVFQQKLQQLILKAAFNGHLDPTSEAIRVLTTHFDDSQRHDGKQLLDYFPEKDQVRSCLRL